MYKHPAQYKKTVQDAIIRFSYTCLYYSNILLNSSALTVW